MNKLTLLLSLSTALTAALASAAPFVSPSGGYSLTLPAGWRSYSDYRADNDATFAPSRPSAASGGMTPIVIITIAPSPPGMTMTALKSKLVPSFKRGSPHTTITSQTSSAIGGMPDLDTVFVTTKQGERVRSRIVYVLKNKFAYAITAVYPEKTHARYDLPIAQMLASVRWKP